MLVFLIIGWLYAWGIVGIAMLLLHTDIIRDAKGSPNIIGAVLVATVWPALVPVIALRWTAKMST